MTDRLIALIVDEGKWLAASMTLAGVGVAMLLLRQRGSAIPVRQRVTAALNLNAGIITVSMASGHLLAVVTKLALGTLREGSLLGFFAIGIGLLIPSILVARHTPAILHGRDDRRTTVLFNGWLAVTLLALGPHNLPLAAPALFAIAHRSYSVGRFGWAIVSIAVVFNAGLFVASLIFLASGQSFEQFRGLE